MKKNVWIILDGKRGHEKQAECLVYSLEKKLELNVTKIKSNSFIRNLLIIFKIIDDPNKNYKKPDLIIGSGHKTHLDILLNKKKYGGKSIVIMKPTLPLFLFDLCIIPEHDLKIPKKNIFLSNGPLNNIISKKNKLINQGIILIGGPSKNFEWDNKEVFEELEKIIDKNNNFEFTICSSRRTPNELINMIQNQFVDKINFVKHDQVSSFWLEREIVKFEYSWVTQDSISMLYELINSGSKVTCIKLVNKNKKFEQLFFDLYNERKINISNMPTNKIILTNIKKSNSDICANYIINKFKF